MSNTQRPSLQRKHTRTTKAKTDDTLNTGISITIDGVLYEARLGDVTPGIARELRRTIGTGFMGLLERAATEPDIDLLAAVVWVASHIKGDLITFEQADARVSYAAMADDGFEISVAGDGEEPDASDPAA